MTGRWRAGVAAVVVLALAGACSPGGIDEVPVEAPETTDAAPTATSGPPATPTPTPTAPGGDPATDGGGGDDAAGEQPAASDPPAGPRLTPVDDGGQVGVNGRAMLRDDRPALVLEVDVQSGVQVDDAAISHLVDVLEGVVAKPAGVRLAGGNTFDSATTSWTAADLRATAQANRATASTDEQVSVHVMYVEGGHARDDGEQTQAIGLAWSASSAVLFPERWSGLGSLLGSGRAIERAVLVHELGHLLGLVNLTYTSSIDHEDPDHPGHSANRQSVMFHAIETTAIGQVFDGPPPDTFDADDRADLEGLRTGRY